MQFFFSQMSSFDCLVSRLNLTDNLLLARVVFMHLYYFLNILFAIYLAAIVLKNVLKIS